MNYKKIIKDLRELNSQLKGQYRDEQNRNYCLQCKIDKLEKEKQELIEYLKGQIKLCKEAQQFALDNKIIQQVGNFNLRIATYEEILNKIEKR